MAEMVKHEREVLTLARLYYSGRFVVLFNVKQGVKVIVFTLATD